MPSTDATASDIPCWAFTDKCRFDPTTGRLRKIGGWIVNTFDYGSTISGVARTLYSATISEKVYTVIGTNSYLYSLIGSNLTNITPLQTSAIAIADSLDTHYATLGSNPLATTNGSNFVVVTDTEAALFKIGDTYTLSGASATNGIPSGELNADHIVRSIGSGTITIYTATAATSTGSGGGGSVVRSSGLLTVNDTAHGLSNGERVKIDSAATTGGITNTQINLEFIIRNVTTNTFDVMTAGTATSSVTGGGGASTKYYPQIAAGAINQGQAQGYGAGLYGVGLYGTALTSSLGATYPRIWFMDRFGNNIIMTAGNSSSVYAWTGSNAVAPAVISNAPTDVNYAFVSDNILVTFGHDVENKIFSSDIGDYTQWTASSTNQVFEDIVEGAGRFISHCPVDGYNLIFTQTQTWTMKYIGLPNVWQILPLDANVGLIAPMARVSVNGIAYWMGQDNFYMFRGGKVETIPSNFGAQSSILRYVFDNLNYSQRFKIFAWYNEEYDEIWIHYPSEGSNECDRVARVNRKLSCWMPDTMDRTAGEWPVTSLSNPRLMGSSTLYTHEAGNDDNDAALPFTATTRKYITGKDTAINSQIVPDSRMTGTITVTCRTSNYPQSTSFMNNQGYSVTSSTERVPTQLNGRYYDYVISGNELGQSFLMGSWFEEPQKGPTAP